MFLFKFFVQQINNKYRHTLVKLCWCFCRIIKNRWRVLWQVSKPCDNYLLLIHAVCYSTCVHNTPTNTILSTHTRDHVTSSPKVIFCWPLMNIEQRKERKKKKEKLELSWLKSLSKYLSDTFRLHWSTTVAVKDKSIGLETKGTETLRLIPVL